jgi:autotransporter-associated beta strand protein
MSVYNVLATQSATLSGAITVNNATWDVETGDTLTISGAISGNGGVTKNGNGTLTLNGTNTYNGSTIVNSGTLEAASAGALGSNNTVQVNGGTLLVSEDDAINGMNITLNGTSTEVATLSFNHDYNGTIGTLTLSANSIIDMGNYNIGADFADLVMGLTNQYTLKIYNWSGATRWGGGTGADQDRISFGGGLSDSELGRISFYSDFGSGFLGTGFELGNSQVIPVPEPETWATGILLVLGGSVWLWRKRRNFTTQSDFEGDAPSAPIEKMVGLFRRNDPNQRQSRPRALPTKSATI